MFFLDNAVVMGTSQKIFTIQPAHKKVRLIIAIARYEHEGFPKFSIREMWNSWWAKKKVSGSQRHID